MAQTIVLALFLAAILAFFCPDVQERLRALFRRRPAYLWLAPPILTAAFAGASVLAHAFSAPLALAVLAYASAPVLCASLKGPGAAERPSALDFLAILLLWFPIEFNAAEGLVPRPAQGFLHTVAYGIAIILGLAIFLCFRAFPGMKYNLPRARRDFRLPLAGFALLAPVLAALGFAIGFLPPPHLPAQHAGRMAAAVGIVFLGTALPEEILFRGLIQNLLMLRWGQSAATLLAASFIFGCAHLDNGPQPLPNWRYMILATVAGWAYGKVFQKSSTVLSSAALHMLVDWTKHFFF
jgi:hypothetical protein